MKNNIKKFLICAFVSAIGVVAPMGDLDISEPNKEHIAQVEFNKELDIYSWESISNIAGASAVEKTVNVVKNEDLTVSASIGDFISGWTNTSVNVRKEPNMKSKIHETYKVNTYILYQELEDGWSIIEYNDGYAYIKSKYISDVKIETKKIQHNNDELYMLSHLIMGESGGASDTCQLYVGSVVLNRIKSSKYPNTMKEVIFQKGQYACTWDGNYDKTPTDRCIKNAKYLLEHGSVLPDNVVYQASFKQGKGVHDIVDGQYFCY